MHSVLANQIADIFTPNDNVMKVTSVMEQDKYLKCSIYLAFTDAENSFDEQQNRHKGLCDNQVE